MELSTVTASQLEYLTAALEHRTWRDAASAVGVSPSGLSQGIAELERRLGVQLFERRGRNRVPTPEADRVRGHADRILAELRELARWSEELRGGSAGRVAIGMIDTAAVHHFGDTLVAFRQSHPDLALRLVVAPSNELIAMLRRGEVDAAVVVDPDDDELAHTPLIEEPLHAYAPSGSAIGDPDSWGPWVGFPSSSRTRVRTARALRRMGAGYDVVAESSQPAVLREMVQLGMGWCVLPATDAESEPHALTRAVATPITTRTLTLIQRPERVATPALERLLHQLVTRPDSIDQ